MAVPRDEMHAHDVGSTLNICPCLMGEIANLWWGHIVLVFLGDFGALCPTWFISNNEHVTINR